MIIREITNSKIADSGSLGDGTEKHIERERSIDPNFNKFPLQLSEF